MKTNLISPAKDKKLNNKTNIKKKGDLERHTTFFKLA